MKHKAKLAGTLRHLLGITGVAVVARGYANEVVVAEVIGVIMALAPFVLSWISPAKKIGEGDFG